MKKSKYIGVKINRLTILCILGNGRVSAVCECGITKGYILQNIVKGFTKSCGCLNAENITKHGQCKHPLYSVWEGMVQRCYNPNHIAYKHYGGRGVTMCNEWKNGFENFMNWALANGWKKGMKIDKDILAPKIGPPVYAPSHCSIVTQTENLRNKKDNRVIEYNGQSMCLKEWSEKLSISYSALRARLDRGWALDRAFTPENFVHNKKKRA